MKKKLTKVLAVVLALVMLASALPMAFAATEIANGTAGEGVTWVLDSDGTLTISGNGAIEVGWYAPPWEFYNEDLLVVFFLTHRDLNGRTRKVVCAADGVFQISLVREVQKPFVVYV